MALPDIHDVATHLVELGVAAPHTGKEPVMTVAPPTGTPKRTVSLIAMRHTFVSDHDIALTAFALHRKV